MSDFSANRTATVTATRELTALVFGSALLVAGVILVAAVMPAEFGIDPLGVGRVLGLTAIGDVQKQVAAFESSRSTSAAGATTIVPQPRRYQDQTVEFTIAPGEFMEYKYRLEKGDALLYSWKTNEPVNYELHAEPDGAPKGYAESYEKASGVANASGTLTAPFAGIHGWYWENTSGREVTVTLSAAGFYTMSHEFRKNAPVRTTMYH
jgi:hypothetical protein